MSHKARVYRLDGTWRVSLDGTEYWSPGWPEALAWAVRMTERWRGRS